MSGIYEIVAALQKYWPKVIFQSSYDDIRKKNPVDSECCLCILFNCERKKCCTARGAYDANLQHQKFVPVEFTSSDYGTVFYRS